MPPIQPVAPKPTDAPVPTIRPSSSATSSCPSGESATTVWTVGATAASPNASPMIVSAAS
jgi:hypothetical protein